jgi:hypothetical protein
MFEYIDTIYYLLTYSLKALFFCYLYYPLYTSCNVQKKIKKNGKGKIISQPKSVLAVIYLLLLCIIFECFTFKIILFVIMVIIIGSLVLTDKFTPKLNDTLYNLNKSTIMIMIWKLLHTFFTLVYTITQPIFSIINNQVQNKYETLKKIFDKIANLNLSSSSNDNFEISSKLNEDLSNISEYFFKSQKKETHITNIVDKTKKSTELIASTESVESAELAKSAELSELTESTKSSKSSELSESSEPTEPTKSTETSKSSAKFEMVKKINEINKDVKNSTDAIEDISLTMTE